ncbi:replication-associated recombination protein A [Candidatus Poribacteria bacterium]|nr:replication-associated recombination protein A [Candidatus Poribacteria bacterium]
MDLFDALAQKSSDGMPLAARMRPAALDDLLGQEHILAPGKPFRREIEADALRSMVLWGPPGCGKTTLARVIARVTQAEFEPFHAATSGVPEIRKLIAKAEERRKYHQRRTILFIDEIHRFNKAQQDVLLPHVEEGTVILIGATTENPSFELTAPLLSRARVIVLRPLEPRHIRMLLARALTADAGLHALNPDIEDEVLDRIVEIADGDARTALNLLESTVLMAPVEDDRHVVRTEHFAEVLKRHAIPHDRRGDNHYQLISALIKSVRGSDPDAAIYWLARLLEAGEDARFVARRLVISASEDVGNADPMALTVADAAAHAVEYVGLPEAQIALAQATAYLASAPKSNAAYSALLRARQVVREQPLYPVPLHLRNAVTALQRELGYAEGYQYAHDADDGYLPQEHLPPELTDRRFYEPKDIGAEADIRARLDDWRRRRASERKPTKR